MKPSKIRDFKIMLAGNLPGLIPFIRKFGIKSAIKQSYLALVAWRRNYRVVQIENKKFLRIPQVGSECQVLIVSGDPSSPSHSYRVDNLVTGYLAQGIIAQWVDVPTFRSLEDVSRNVKLIIFWRTNLDFHDFKAMKRRESSTFPTVIYDTDDITFDKEIYTVDNVDGLKYVGRTERDFLVKTLAAQKSKQIVQSDFGFAPTQGILDSYAKFGLKGLKVPNVLPRWMEFQAEALHQKIQNRTLRDGELRIVYASGSKTHGVDFQAAWSAIQKYLKTNTRSSLTVLGHSPITKNDIPADLESQIEFVDFVEHEEMLSHLSEFNLQIAPVEVGNPFVEGKSALKFMHGAALGIPTIASPSAEFASVIDNNVNGWLANSEAEWLTAFHEAGLSNKWQQVSNNARKSFLQEHRIEALMKPLGEVFEEANDRINGEVQEVRSEQGLKSIVWVIPDLPAGSGGHRNILRFANYLPKNTFKSTVLVLNTSDSDADMIAFVHEHYGFMGFDVTSNRSAVQGAAFVFATHHSTVDFVTTFSPLESRMCYLVQDFEPYFYPMGSNFLHALDSYFKSELNIICSGPWMSGKIKEISGRSVPYFDFPVARAVYKPTPELNRRGVVFFAKADTPRRLFDLGIQALRVFRIWNPGVEITLFGGSASQMREYEGEFNVLGRLDTLNELGELYRGSKVGLVFSTTNPSLVPYEMMACGLPVVDVAVRADEFSKYGSPPSAILAEANPTSIALAMTTLCNDEENWNEHSELGLALSASFPDEIDTSGDMSKFLLGLD